MRKNDQIIIRVSTEEKLWWKKSAIEEGMSLSEWIRKNMPKQNLNGKRKTRLTMASEMKGAN